MSGKLNSLKNYLDYVIISLYSKTKHPKKFKNYNDFTKLLENKQVCLVGPAEYIDKEFTNYGKIIDSFDIVVRVNSFLNVNKSLHKNYGKKTDILITSLWKSTKSSFCLKESYTEDKINHPLLIYYQNGRLRNFFLQLFELNKNITICEQPKNNLKDLLNILNHSPTTGMLAIHEILKCNPKQLYVTGMTFGLDQKHKDYVDGYYPHYRPPEKVMNKDGFAGSHNLVAEFNLTKKLILNNKNLEVDSYLSKELFKFND